jgi:hypothetical protein
MLRPAQSRSSVLPVEQTRVTRALRARCYTAAQIAAKNPGHQEQGNFALWQRVLQCVQCCAQGHSSTAPSCRKVQFAKTRIEALSRLLRHSARHAANVEAFNTASFAARSAITSAADPHARFVFLADARVIDVTFAAVYKCTVAASMFLGL